MWSGIEGFFSCVFVQKVVDLTVKYGGERYRRKTPPDRSWSDLLTSSVLQVHVQVPTGSDCWLPSLKLIDTGWVVLMVNGEPRVNQTSVYCVKCVK